MPYPLCLPISTQGHPIHPRIGRGLCYVYPLIAKEDSELIPNKRLYHLFAFLANKNEAISWAHSIGLTRLHVIPSPSPDVVITPFDEARHPAFKEIFESQPEDSPLRHLIGPSGSLDEAMLDHVQAGGGFITGIRGGTKGPQPDVVEVTFEIDLVVFADGEIAGPDPDRFAALLQCRKRAAEFVAQQVRLAAAEGRDAIPVISALAEFPHLGRPGHGQYDPLVHMSVEFAREYLRRVQDKIGELNMQEGELRRLENRPELPKFYRRQQPG